MKLLKLLPIAIIPFLFIIVFIFGYFTIIENWNYEISTYATFVFTTTYILVFEQLSPLKSNWKTKKDDLWVDIKHFLFSITLFDAIGKTASLSFFLYLEPFFFKPFEIWNKIPFVFTFIIANIIGEFLPYIYHRLSHVGKKSSRISLFLWKIHSTHHLPTSLNWFKTNWIHPINMFLNTLLKMIPLLLLGFDQEIIYLVGITHIVIAYISHANIKTNTYLLDYIIVTPHIHHFHHSKLINEAKNFGNIIPFWDLLFGTYYNRKGEVKNVGVVESDFSYPQKKRYIKQLIFPFIGCYKNCC